MKLLYCILSFFVLCIYAQDGDSFTIQFYKKANYKEDAGIISGSVAVGGGGGAKSGNMSVGSFTAEEFLQVTLYTEKYYQGKNYVYKGSQKKISPAVHVGSVKWKHL